MQGSVEAIIGALEKVGNDEVAARVIHAGAGGINESDITLAKASGAVVIGFNVRANKEAREAAERTGVEIRYYNIIYDLVDDMKQAMSGLLAPDAARRTSRRGPDPAGLRDLQGRQGGGLPRAPTDAWSAARTCASSATTSSSTKASCRRSSASRTRSRKSAPARSAAWPSRTTRTCATGDIIECYRVEEIRRSL